MKPIKFCDLPVGALFRMFAERRPHYVNGERVVGMVRSKEHRVFKKKGQSHASTKEGRDIIPALHDLVVPYEVRK